MRDYCDLLRQLNSAPNRKIRNVEIYGGIVRTLEHPPYFSPNTIIDPDCICVEVKVFGIRFGLPDPVKELTGDCNSKQMYFCSGTICTYVNKSVPLGDWYSLKGNLSIPKGRGTDKVVNLFRFKKKGGDWVVIEAQAGDILLEEWDASGRMIQYLRKSAGDGKFYQPREVLMLPPCCSETEGVENKSPERVISELSPDELGVSEQSRVTPEEYISEVGGCTLSNTTQESEQSLVRPTGDLVIQDRYTPVARSPLYEPIKRNLDRSLLLKSDYVDTLVDKYELNTDEDSEYVAHLLNNIIKYWDSKPTRMGSTGKSLVKNYMENSKVNTSQDYQGTTAGDYLLCLGTNLIKCAQGKEDLEATKEALDVGKKLFSNAEELYAGILSRIVGLDTKKLVSIAERCNKLELSFSQLVNNNPYGLLLVSSELRFSDIEELAMCLGKATDKELSKERNIGLLYDHTLNCNGGDTVYLKDTLYRAGIGVSVSESKYDALASKGTFLTVTRQSNILAYINSTLTVEDWGYPTRGWVSKGRTKTLPLSKAELDKALVDFKESGLGVEFEVDKKPWVCNSRTLEKELYVYSALYKLAESKTAYDLGEINSIIQEFEYKKGFQLEQKQRDAVRLTTCGCGVVTGPAGSGKTTVSEAMVYALEKQNPDIVIQYAAPTGKAAKRLQEVVGGKVRTMHSMFRVFGGDASLFDNEDDDGGNDEPDVYFFDESAMVTIDLLYAVLRKITRAQVFFLGDIEQLPPIGKGLPFKNALSFLPCVALTVSKRSAEGSDITANSKRLTDGRGEDLRNGKDFRLVECADDNIDKVVSEICAYHLGKGAKGNIDMLNLGVLNADDIQVISPLAVDRYSWGANKLNVKLQDLFNPRKEGEYFEYRISKYSSREFRLGDRVIHTSNMYPMVHYTSWVGGVLQKTWDLGVMNGDVGKVVGVLNANACRFVAQDCSRPEGDEREMRVDEDFSGDNKYFIVVKYYDFEKDCDYFVLYQTTLNATLSTETDTIFGGFDLGMLQLAYALTIHKMQGSESKLVIMALGQVKMQGFVSRNMLYTGISRAKEGSYVVGSVSNHQASAMSRARSVVATNGVDTVMGVI